MEWGRLVASRGRRRSPEPLRAPAGTGGERDGGLPGQEPRRVRGALEEAPRRGHRHREDRRGRRARGRQCRELGTGRPPRDRLPDRTRALGEGRPHPRARRVPATRDDAPAPRSRRRAQHRVDPRLCRRSEAPPDRLIVDRPDSSRVSSGGGGNSARNTRPMSARSGGCPRTIGSPVSGAATATGPPAARAFIQLAREIASTLSTQWTRSVPASRALESPRPRWLASK